MEGTREDFLDYGDIKHIRIVRKLGFQGTSRIFYNRFFGVEQDSGVLQKVQLISIYRQQ